MIDKVIHYHAFVSSVTNNILNVPVLNSVCEDNVNFSDKIQFSKVIIHIFHHQQTEENLRNL